MISHETLTKATVAGAVTVVALSLPFIFDRAGVENDEAQNPVTVKDAAPYNGPALHAAPSIAESSRDVARAESTKPRAAQTGLRTLKINGQAVGIETKNTLSAFDPSTQRQAERRSSARVLKAGIARPELNESSK